MKKIDKNDSGKNTGEVEMKYGHTLFEVSCKVALFNRERTKVVLVRYEVSV